MKIEKSKIAIEIENWAWVEGFTKKKKILKAWVDGIERDSHELILRGIRNQET